MRNESQMRMDVENALKCNPDIDATDVGVAVKDGVVMLTGYVRSYFQKLQIERYTKRVDGVVGVANDIEVRLPHIDQRHDAEIARSAVAALRADLPYSSESVRVVVKRRLITLEGSLEWHYQRYRAELAVQSVRGIRGFTDSIKLRPLVDVDAIEEKIEYALNRRPGHEAAAETADSKGGDVGPRGTVKSWAQRDDFENTSAVSPALHAR